MHCTGYSVSLIQLKVKMKCINCPITTLLTSTVTLSMEDGGVDRTVIDCQQNQLGQIADFPPLLTILLLKFDVPQIKSPTMRHTLMNLGDKTLFGKYVYP